MKWLNKIVGKVVNSRAFLLAMVITVWGLLFRIWELENKIALLEIVSK